MAAEAGGEGVDMKSIVPLMTYVVDGQLTYAARSNKVMDIYMQSLTVICNLNNSKICDMFLWWFVWQLFEARMKTSTTDMVKMCEV